MNMGTRVLLIDVTHRTEDDEEEINSGSLNLVSHMLSQSAAEPAVGSVPTVTKQSQWPKCFPRKMEIEVMWDQSFCAQFENNASYAAFQIAGTVAKIVPLFEVRTCVSVTVTKFVGFCKEGKRATDPLERMPSLDDCLPKDGCKRPSVILQAVRNFWWSRNITSNVPDSILFLSGYDDGTSVVGAAWVGGACTTYRFGWAEKLRHQVIAHEIGHLLGAGHSRYGLMRGLIDIIKIAPLAKDSAAEIWNFVRNPRKGWCLSRDGKQRNQRTTFQDLVISPSGDLEPESVFIYDSVRYVGIKFLMLIRNKTNPIAPLSYIRYERQSLSGNEVTNTTKQWNDTNTIWGPDDIPIDRKWPLECAAITTSRNDLPVILTVRKNGPNLKAFYLISRGNENSPTPTRWLPPRIVPVPFSAGTVQACSICESRKNLVFGFAKTMSPGHVALYYRIERSISWKGFPTNGSTGLKEVPGVINGTVIAMNVNAFDILKDEVVDLVFSYIMIDTNGRTQLKILVGFAISLQGDAEGGWSQVVEYEPLPENKLTRTSIGHAILVARRSFIDSTGRKKDLNLPTVGFIDTVAEKDSYRLLLQHEALSNGIFYEASIVENGEAVPACEKCYSKFKSESCVSLRLECSEARARLPVLETAVLKDDRVPSVSRSVATLKSRASNRASDNGNASDVGYPDNVGTDELFCAGVYKLFIEKTGGSCAGKVSDAWIVTAGLAQTMLVGLEEELQVGQTNSTWEVTDFNVIFAVNGTSSDDSLDGAFADVKEKGPSQIRIYSKKYLRKVAIARVVKKHLNRGDYSRWFGNGKQPTLDRSRYFKNGYRFVVTLSYPFNGDLFR